MEIIADLILPILIGWAIGSLTNYLCDTLPAKRRIQNPFCQICGAEFSLTNYILWPRRCGSCGSRRHWRVEAVELFLILASLWLWHNPPANLGYWVGIILLAYFTMIAVIDLEWRLILHLTSLFGLLLGILIGTALHGFSITLAGGATGFLLMLILYFSGFLFLRISRKFRGEALSETEALGFGDVNLGGVIGLLLGWPGIFLGLILAIVLAGIISLLYIMYKIIRHQYHPNIALPYGPFLATSAIILLYLRNYLF